LFRNANSQKSKQDPAEKGSDTRKNETLDSYKPDSSENENNYGRERKGKEKRRGTLSNRWMQAQ
jgi:hypothetical protein